MQIKLDIADGSHVINAYPVEGTESLEVLFSWHEPIVIHDWTCRKLLVACDHADSPGYVAAEALFIRFFGETPRPHPY